MKYSIIMPYVKRIRQFERTLRSFDWHYRFRNDFELVVVEDSKNIEDKKEHKMLVDMIGYYQQSFPIIHLEIKQKVYNPAPLYNAGAVRASGKFYMITSPECFHKSNVLGGLDRIYEEGVDNYIVCGVEHVKDLIVDGDFNIRFKSIRWYQHTKHRNKQYHFCTVISQKNFLRVGGFDSVYTNGIGYDDDDFITAIRNTDDIEIINRDDFIVLHQIHEKQSVKADKYRQRLLMNKEIYKRKWGEEA